MAWNIRTSRQVSFDLEVLVNPVNVEVAASIVIDASTIAADGNGLRHIAAGTPMTKNVSNQYEPFTDEVAQTNGCAGILTFSYDFPDATSASDTPAAVWCHGQWFRTDRIVGWSDTSLRAAIKLGLPTCKFS